MGRNSWEDSDDGRPLYVRFLFASMYYRGATTSRPYIGVDFEKTNSLVLQDSLRRLRSSHFLDFIGLRFRA